jgi:hypothetical protein
MSKELSDKNKAVIDRLFINGFDRIEAWQSQFPKSQEKYAGVSCYQMLERANAKEYYTVKHEEFKQSFNIDKHIMVEKLLHQVDTFDAMIALAGKDNLTDDEADKLERLSNLIKGSDIMKAKDMICKLIDAYTPTKIEVTNKTYRVGFDLSDEDLEP